MVSEPMLGEIRLQWWRETLDQIYGGGPVRAHEVAHPLAEAVRASSLPRTLLDALIDARASDLDPAFLMDDAALQGYIAATAGGLTQLATTALVPEIGEESGQIARDAGFAIGAARYLLAVPQLVAGGRKPLPMAGRRFAGGGGTGSSSARAQKPPCRTESGRARIARNRRCVSCADGEDRKVSLSRAPFAALARGGRALVISASSARRPRLSDPAPACVRRIRGTVGRRSRSRSAC